MYQQKKETGLKKTKIQKGMFIGLFVMPSFLAYVILGLYPNILSVYYSLLQWDGISKKKFVGLFNFSEMLKDQFLLNALYHNLLLILVVPLVILLISILFADLLINHNFHENRYYKVIYYFPNVLSAVIISLIWVFIFDGRNGLLNSILKLAGIDMKDFYWLGDVRTSLISVAIPVIWSAVGFYIIIIMNAMSSIPVSLYESAFLEGINNIQRLFKITIPLIMGVIRVSAIFIMLGIVKGFEMIMILTKGGPSGSTDVIGLYMFNYAFGTGLTGGVPTNYGYASAIGMLLFIILLLLKLLVDKIFSAEAYEF